MASEEEPVQLVHIGMEPLNLDHIGIAHEPDVEPERRKRKGRAASRPVRHRAAHGASIQRDVESTMFTVTAKRRQLGIAPDRLLVVEFHSWDPACRDVFEQRFGARVVDERLVTDGGGNTLSHVKVQFPSLQSISNLKEEIAEYRRSSDRKAHLPPGLRGDFLDGIESVRLVAREDRIGNRLRQEGFPDEETFHIDVDLWHPGAPDRARAVLEDLRQLCSDDHGRVTEDLQTNSLVLARVLTDQGLAEKLLDLDTVAQVNLPPVMPSVYRALFCEQGALPATKQPTGDEPLVTVIDSGVLSGHPLLRGWVLDETDFDSGEETVVDQQGHGTNVAGLVVYGSIASCLKAGTWTPEVLIASAKVLQRQPATGRPAFPEKHRPEALVNRAIRHYHDTRGCRVFNLSLGNDDDVYAGGRQFAWAELLDQLARKLDIVIVVSAGNHNLEIPDGGATRGPFQEEVRNALLSAPSRLCNPATAAIAVTVGSVARSEAHGTRDSFAAAPAGAPAPFTRTGPGYESKSTNRAVKPEFVAFGGNYGVRRFAGSAPRWSASDVRLGEPTTRLTVEGDRPLTAVSGTSFAAPQVCNAAAWALETTSGTLGTTSANAARALLGVCAETPPCGPDWLLDPEQIETWEKLQLSGFGMVNAERVRASRAYDVCLVASSEVQEDHWHTYSVPVPLGFRSGSGPRGIVLSLAFDPPVRASRREYLARTMWIEATKGLTLAELESHRTPRKSSNDALRLPQSKLLPLRPSTTALHWSTLQVRRKTWQRAPALPLAEGDHEPQLRIVVGCHRRFQHGEGDQQRYSIAVRLWHSDARVDLYNEVRSRVRERARAVVQARTTNRT